MGFRRDWICSLCGNIEENIPTDVQERECSVCGSRMEKIYTPPLVMFKGDGWTGRNYDSGWNGEINNG